MKKRVLSILLTLCLALTLLPVSAWAEDNIADVSTTEGLKNALTDENVKEIHITADMTYNDSLDASKPVQVNEGVTLTLSDYETTVSGRIINNGTIQVNSNKCFWTATTFGTGKLIGGKDSFGSYSTYVDYGCVPEAMLEGSNCLINIVKDISQSVTATLPDTMQTGDTIEVTFSNLIEGVDPAKVFNFVWKDGSSFPIYDGQATPTLTQSGTLKLSLSMKKPYVMRTSSGTRGSLDAQGTVTQKPLDTIYVDQNNGNDSNLGDTAAQPVKSIDKALDKITDGGKIVLLSNYSGQIVFNKSVTVKSEDGNDFALTSPNYVSDGVTVTLEKLNFSDSNFRRSTQGTGSLVFKNCTGSLSIGSGDISNITMENSQLSGNISASESLAMRSSTFSGKFNTKNFSADGDCTINCKKNAPSRISGTVTAGTPVKLVPFENAKAGDKLLEVPDSTAATSFALSDTSGGVYGVVFSEQFNGKYLCLAQRITSENGKIAVGYEPQIKHVPNDPAYVRLSGFDSEINTSDAAWSGNANTSWSADEIPKLTVTLKASDFYFFDDSFDVNKLQVYSWTDMTSFPSFDNGAKNDKVTCKVEEGQGVSNDGKSFTFTVVYPKIERLKQNLIMETTDRTASCKEVLQPRQVNHPQGTTLSYESSDPEIASVDSANGEITVNKPGTVTITIHSAQTDTYAAAQISYNLVISHKYSDTYKADGESHWKECVCGERTEIGNHSGGTATCTEQATCEICGEKYGDLKPHSYSTEWSTDETNHWHECTECRAKTDEAEHTDGNKDHKCDVCDKVLSECADTNKDHKCDLCGKTLSEHSGGTATCKDKAKCEICGEIYGELNANNHSDLKHIDAKAATKTAVGNIEYWYCADCGKYYKDAKATQEITKEQTVTAKLPSDNNTSAGGSTGNNNKPSSNATTSPQTGDNSNLTLWIALLFASGGAVTATAVISNKKKRSVK